MRYNRKGLEPMRLTTELIDRARKMLVPSKGGEGFSQHYDEALQRDPDVVFAHSVAARLMRANPKNTPS